MRKISHAQRQLLAEFLSNLGVAWFAGGIIGVFISGTNDLFKIIISVFWGLLLSAISLSGGMYLTRKLK